MPYRYSKRLGRRVWKPTSPVGDVLTRQDVANLKHLKAINQLLDTLIIDSTDFDDIVTKKESLDDQRIRLKFPLGVKIYLNF